jgi:predicted glycosyl hydrolase (DUF1957 family)
MASIAMEHLTHVIDKHRENLISKIKNHCRSEKHDVIEYASTIAAINCLDDVQREIKKQIDAAINVEKGALNNEHTN